MKKQELIKVAEENGMEFISNPITHQKFGVYLTTDAEVEALDCIVESDNKIVNGTREYRPDGSIHYRIFCPTEWMDLYGWC